MSRDMIYYQEALRRTKEQDESRKHFDNMATTILGFSAVVISLILLRNIPFESSQIYVIASSLIMFLGVAISTLNVLWLRKWEFNPPLSDLYKNIESSKYDDKAIILWTGRSISDTYKSNNITLRRKAYSLSCAHIFLLLEVISVGVLIIISF